MWCIIILIFFISLPVLTHHWGKPLPLAVPDAHLNQQFFCYLHNQGKKSSQKDKQEMSNHIQQQSSLYLSWSLVAWGNSNCILHRVLKVIKSISTTKWCKMLANLFPASNQSTGWKFLKTAACVRKQFFPASQLSRAGNSWYHPSKVWLVPLFVLCHMSIFLPEKSIKIWIPYIAMFINSIHFSCKAGNIKV